MLKLRLLNGENGNGEMAGIRVFLIRWFPDSHLFSPAPNFPDLIGKIIGKTPTLIRYDNYHDIYYKKVLIVLVLI